LDFGIHNQENKNRHRKVDFINYKQSTMRFPRHLFRRKGRDHPPSVLDYETTEALASVLAGSPTKNSMDASNQDETIHESSTSLGPSNSLGVDWKLPILDSTTTNEQTIEDELQRLIALQSYNLLEIEREEIFDRITRLAAEVFEAPVAIINLVDLGRTWFVSGHGTNDLNGTSRKESFCAHVVQGKVNRPLIVPDLTKDFRFKDFSTVLGPPYLRFYSGAPLVSPEGYKLGALCIMDVIPRKHGLLGFEEEILVELADMAMKIMVERREKMRELVNEINQDTTFLDNSWCCDLENLLGPPMTNMPKLLQSLNALVDSLPRKVPITIELDSNVPLEIECKDVLLLRAALSLLNHSAGRTEKGSIHLRIQLKKKNIVFQCEDTGPVVSTKPKHIRQYIDSLPKSSGMSTMVALVRSMGGEYGIDAGASSNRPSSTTFWFSPNPNQERSKLTPTSSTNKMDSTTLRMTHIPNQSIDTTEMMTSKLKNLNVVTNPFEASCDMCSNNPKKM
jgi:GAF domain